MNSDDIEKETKIYIEIRGLLSVRMDLRDIKQTHDKINYKSLMFLWYKRDKGFFVNDYGYMWEVMVWNLKTYFKI